MKTPYFKSLALIGVLTCSLTASAEKSYMQVPSTHWLKNGSTYLVGGVTANTNAQANFPRFYNMNTAGDKVIQTKMTDFTDVPATMEWTLQAIEGVNCACSGNPTESPIFAMTQNGQAIINSGNGSELNLTNESPLPASTYVAFVPQQVNAMPGETLFVTHINWDNSAHYLKGARAMGVRGNDPQFNVYSDNGTSSVSVVVNDANYSTVSRIYLVIDSENLATAAATIWEGMTEDDIAAHPAYSDARIEALRNRELPDITSATASSLQAFLTEEFAKPVEVNDVVNVASQYANKYLRIHHVLTKENVETERFISEINGELKASASAALATSLWKAEYVSDADALLLTLDGKYLSALPNAQGGAFQLVNDRNAAGLYKIYTAYNANNEFVGYTLSCTKLMNGTAITTWQHGAAAGSGLAGTDLVTNIWMQDGGGNAPTQDASLIRWGSNPDNAKWQISTFDNIENIEDFVNYLYNARYPNLNTKLMAEQTERINAAIASLTSEREKLAVYEHMAANAYTTTPTANKFYRIKSAREFTSGVKAISYNGNTLRWETVNTDDNKFLWIFTPVSENTYLLRNALDGRYIKTILASNTASNVSYEFQTLQQTVTIDKTTPNDSQVFIKNEKSFHCLNHGGGSGSNGNIIGYLTTAEISNPSSWYLEEVTADEAAAMIEAYKAAATDNVPAAVKEAALAIIDNDEATLSQKCDAYLSFNNANSLFAGKVIKIRSTAATARYGCFNNGTDGNDAQFREPGDDLRDFLFVYTADHKLHHILSGMSLNGTYKIKPLADGVVVNLLYTANEGEYKLKTPDPDNRYAHCHNANENNYTWNRCASDGCGARHIFSIELATDAEIQQLIDGIEIPSLEGTDFVEGTNAGNLVSTPEQWTAYKNGLNINASNFTYDMYAALKTNSIDNLEHAYEVAPVPTGRYYRIKASAKNLQSNNVTNEERYLSSANNNNKASFQNEATLGTIFYYTPAKHFVSAETGRYVVLKSDFMANHTGALPSSEAPAEHGANVFEFKKVRHSELGAYEITFDTRVRTLHLTGTAADACGSLTSDHPRHNFVLEEVTELPISIQAQGYGSFIAPVPAVIEGATGVYAEVITNSETRAFELQPMAEGAVIPANTPVFVMGGAGETATATLQYQSAEAPAAVRSRAAEETEANGIINIRASHVAQGITTTEGMKAFALCPATTESEKGNATDIHFAEITDGIQPANTVCISVDANHPIVSGSKAVMSIGEEYTTEIREISAAGSAAEVIYDLQGRRLTKPVHGINIINGRKVYVK